MSSIVLITGVSRLLGGRLAALLSADPAIERIIGIDTAPPRGAALQQLGRAEFVRADIRNPLVAKVIGQARVTTVVHASLLASPRQAGGRVPMQELNVTGTMQLLAACQHSDTVERVVLKSTAAVYGAGPDAPAVFTEDMPPLAGSRSGFAKDAVEVEGYLRGFGRRRPDVAVAVLRLADLVGPTVDSALSRYLAMPVVPTPLGYDPRLQLLHESDAVEVLRSVTTGRFTGTVNVAGDGVLTLSQVVRRAGHRSLPVPAAAIGALGGLVRNAGVADLGPEEVRYLTYGRALDTTALRERVGYLPRYSTERAVDEVFAPRWSRPGRVRRAVLGST
ncbi:UDP-glucose 4-epimerase [Jatrophihabitans endophyticus]|uniref:UDP-glucose 4-epimerase n=1 Tax=Jatrophihabitans endophyticus TaxID=1206085 RepID=A0A1M5QWU4_9ACTN|nr:NAD-dependent epimerase/dehydratase family protein [Jatrophihabitans endophyticus]SHH18624.1 UDP-glucose 4-epimerase [Jatrophihabitans endophyticus]